ncbi:25952_t:CDS:1, partial [Gigaspora rosea]
WDKKSEVPGASFSNGLGGIGGVMPNLMVQWSMPSLQYFQPGQPCFIPSGIPLMEICCHIPVHISIGTKAREGRGVGHG